MPPRFGGTQERRLCSEGRYGAIQSVLIADDSLHRSGQMSLREFPHRSQQDTIEDGESSISEI